MVPKHFSMLGKAMRFATMCTLAFAICGKANRHNVAAVSNATIEDFAHRVGSETSFEDHSSTTKTVPSIPIRKASSTGSSTQVRRRAKILLLGSSVSSSAASAPRGVQPAGVRVLQQDGNIDLEDPALNVAVGGILGPTSWEKYESLTGFAADLQGWGLKDLGEGRELEDRGLKHHEGPFGAGRKLKIRGPKDKASGLSSSNTKARPSKHKVDIPANQPFEKFLKRGLELKGKYVHSDGVQEALDMDKFLQTPGWLVRVFTLPSVIEFMAENSPVTKDGTFFKDAVTVMLAARFLDEKVSEAVQWLSKFFKDNPDIFEMEENLNEDLKKAMAIMTDA